MTGRLRAENLSLAGLKAGKHRLRVLVDLRSTKRVRGRYRFKTVLLTSHFTVCG